MTNYTATTIRWSPLKSTGLVDTRTASIRIPGGGTTASVTHYSLAAFDNTNVRHYWVDTTVSFTNAPAGPTYISNTLTVLGVF